MMYTIPVKKILLSVGFFVLAASLVVHADAKQNHDTGHNFSSRQYAAPPRYADHARHQTPVTPAPTVSQSPLVTPVSIVPITPPPQPLTPIVSPITVIAKPLTPIPYRPSLYLDKGAIQQWVANLSRADSYHPSSDQYVPQGFDARTTRTMMIAAGIVAAVGVIMLFKKKSLPANFEKRV